MSHMVQNIDIKCPSRGPRILISSHCDCPTVNIMRVLELITLITSMRQSESTFPQVCCGASAARLVLLFALEREADIADAEYVSAAVAVLR